MNQLHRTLLPLVLLALAAASAPAQSIYERYRFTTLVGNPPSHGSNDGIGSAARFNGPQGVAVDKAGNVYVADTDNHTIRKVTPAGLVTTVAGKPLFIGRADGNGSSARFAAPFGIAADGAGNLYVAEASGNWIRKVTPAGDVSVFAGAGTVGGTDGAGSAAQFNSPEGVALDKAGNLYVADFFNHTIRKISPAGVVTTWAGATAIAGYADGPGNAARFNAPRAVAVDSADNVFVADFYNHIIRKITPDGVVSTFAGTPGGPGSDDGTGTNARFKNPIALTTDSAGNVYVGDSNATIRKITPAGVVTTLAGSVGNPGSADGMGPVAQFNLPYGLAADSAGNIYVGDNANSTIRKVTPDGSVTTLAGLAQGPLSADGSGTAVRFAQPWAVAKDSAGNLYVADAFNSTIRKVTADGAVSTFAGSPQMTGSTDGVGNEARFTRPVGIALDSQGNIFVSDSGIPDTFPNGATIRKITPGGVVTTFAGSATQKGNQDGAGPAARFYFPGGIAIDGADNIYVADTGNHRIRKITPTGIVTTLAGSTAGSADGVGPLGKFFGPGAVAVANDGNLFVADSGNETIRKVTPLGEVTTFAGQPGTFGYADGTRNAARFWLGFSNGCYEFCGHMPRSGQSAGIAVDAAGNVYVSDCQNNLIRKITPSGAVTTIAGVPAPVDNLPASTDGSGRAARFEFPNGLFVDAAGYIYVADTQNNTIRVGGPTAVAQSLNIATRAQIQGSNDALIAGFIVTGSAPKKVALRAIGPSLSKSNVPGALSDPTLELLDSSGVRFGINDDWRDAGNADEVQAAGLAPTNDREAAFIATLPPNKNYTAVVRGKDNVPGVALVEVYDLNPTADSLPANLSTRGFVGTAANVMIGGFILGQGNAADKVVVRALGPSLEQFAISNPLSDPTLELHDGNGALLASNNDWKDTDRSAVEATGLAPSNDLESAIVKMLPAGNYTAIVAGRDGRTGVGLVEVYNLQ
ncbi:MAG: hypothetical protein QOF24_770 [Verrucomicrobiota bacterium]